MSRILLRIHGHLKYVVHVPDADLSAAIRRDRPLLVFFKSHMIVFDGLGEVPPLVLACTTGIGSIDMIGVDIENGREIIYALLELSDFLEGTASDIVSAGILGVQIHQRVAVLDGLGKAALL